MYLKISNNQYSVENSGNSFSLNLNKDEKIINIETLNNENLLFNISDSNKTYAIIYDVKNNKNLFKYLENKKITRTIYVENKLLNFIVK